MKCKECGNELIEIYKQGEVVWCEHYVDEEGELRDYDEGRYHGEEKAELFCKECKQFVYYWFTQAHCDTDNYMQIQEQAELDKDGLKILLNNLGKVMLESPECVNFSNLKEACEVLKIDISDVMKSIAFGMIEQQRPEIYIPRDLDENEDDEVPF